MNPLKITIVQGAFLPVPPRMGGAVEKIWYGLGAEFACRGHRVTHFSRLWDDLPSAEMLAGVYHLRVPGFDTPPSLAKLKLLDLRYSLRVRRELPPADILVTHCFWLPMLVRSRRPGRLYVHVARYPKGQMRLYGHAARLQAVSGSVADAIRAQVPHLANKVTMVPNPLPDAAYVPEADFEVSSLSPGTNLQSGHTVLYVGRVHPEKGIGLLLDAFTRFRECDGRGWRLAIVGPWETKLGGGGEEYYRELRERSRPSEAHIDWVGPVFDPDALREHYRLADLFVYPSLAEKGESFGLAPLEAMAAGCTVIVSDLACFRDFLQVGRNGFVFNHRSPNPEEELATRLGEAARVPDRSAIVRASIETAQRYRMGRVAELYLKDFHSIV